MDDSISRATAIQMVKEKPDMTPDEKAGVVARLQAIPAADVRPAKRGHWVKRMEEKETPYYKALTPIWSCSECGLDYDPALAPRIHFCYNCGADLREYDHKREN